MEHPLTRYRRASNRSMLDLAKAVGTTRQTIHRIENGKQQPSWNLARRLVAATSGAVTANDFLLNVGRSPKILGSGGRD